MKRSREKITRVWKRAVDRVWQREWVIEDVGKERKEEKEEEEEKTMKPYFVELESLHSARHISTKCMVNVLLTYAQLI